MKMVKGILAAVFAVSLLSACGNNNNNNASPAPSSAAPSTAVESSAPEATGTLAEIKKRGVLIVGSSNDAPFSYIDTKTKEYTGIDAEIIKEIAKRLGIEKVEMKTVKFENLLIELNNKTIDIVADAMYIKDERKKVADFTNVWYQDGDALIVRSDSTIAGLDDLSDKVVGAVKGTTFLEYLEKLKTEGKIKDIIIFNSQAEGLLGLNTNKMDAFVTDGGVAAYSIKSDSVLDLKIVETYEPQFNGQIGAAVRKGDTEFLDAVNAELDKLKEEKFTLEVLKKYNLNENNYVPAGQ